jgi:hypothetical protein
MNSSVIKPTSLARVSDNEGRFRTLVQSPLRAGILRFLYARTEEAFDVEALMTDEFMLSENLGNTTLTCYRPVREPATAGRAPVKIDRVLS